MISKGHTSLTLKEIYKRVSQETILEYYFGINHVPCLINSPFRKDNNPSFAFYYSPFKDIYWKDFGTDESGNLIEFIKQSYHISYIEVLDLISKDLIDSFNNPKRVSTVKRKKYKQYNSDSRLKEIKVKKREWEQHDIEYWESYGVNQQWLEYCEVYPISHIFFYFDYNQFMVSAEKYAYVFIERKDNLITHKVYQPYSELYKWKNENKKDTWELWNKIPDSGDILIITSSRKDAMCIMCNTHIPSIALQSEGVSPKEHVVNQLKERFKRIYCLFDTDSAGRKFGKDLEDKFNLKQIEIPIEYEAKDSSDLYLKHGKETLIKVINNLINDTQG